MDMIEMIPLMCDHDGCDSDGDTTGMVSILLMMVGWSFMEVNRMILMSVELMIDMMLVLVIRMMMIMFMALVMLMVTIFPISTQLHMHPNHEQCLGMWVS